MSSRLLQLAAHRTRTLALVAVAVLAGATGGVWAVAGAPSPGVTVTTVADENGDAADTGDEAEKPDKPAKADKAEKPEKPEKAGKPEKSEKTDGSGSPEKTAGAGVHGACVSAVARSDATGGKNDNHGGAVSQAAHTCPPKDPGADRPNPTP